MAKCPPAVSIRGECRNARQQSASEANGEMPASSQHRRRMAKCPPATTVGSEWRSARQQSASEANGEMPASNSNGGTGGHCEVCLQEEDMWWRPHHIYITSALDLISSTWSRICVLRIASLVGVRGVP